MRTKEVPIPSKFLSLNRELFAPDQSSILRTQREELNWYGNLLGTEHVHQNDYIYISSTARKSTHINTLTCKDSPV